MVKLTWGQGPPPRLLAPQRSLVSHWYLQDANEAVGQKTAQKLTFGQGPLHSGQHGFLQRVTHQGPVVHLHQRVAGGNYPVCFSRNVRHGGHVFPISAGRDGGAVLTQMVWLRSALI